MSILLNRTCQNCGAGFHAFKFKIDMGFGRFCSRKCFYVYSKGEKKPHSKEWEEKRVAALKISGARRKGIPTGRPPTKKVMEALLKWKDENKEAHRKNSIANLPKNVNGSLNGNWKGGITIKNRGLRFSKEYRHWRKVVLKRDGGKCRECGTTEGLQVHHIIPMSECLEIYDLPMNGVTLCKKHHFENDEAWNGKRFKKMNIGVGATALIFTIPNKFQAYPTVGNWQITKSGTVVIFVSDMGNKDYEFLVSLHELVEVKLCKKRGITTSQVDRFDIDYEKKRTDGDFSEPGDNRFAPYQNEHCIATGIERIVAAALGVKWSDYEQEINSL
jgi:5-methylcytosine-specific restriction endonuclease McrA